MYIDNHEFVLYSLTKPLFYCVTVRDCSLHIARPPQSWLEVLVPYAISNIFQLYHGGKFYCLEEKGIPGENQRPVISHITLYRVLLT